MEPSGWQRNERGIKKKERLKRSGIRMKRVCSYDDRYVLGKRAKILNSTFTLKKDPGKSSKTWKEEHHSSRAQKLAAAGLLDALPFLDPASLKSCMGGPPGPCLPGTGRSSKSALRPSSPAHSDGHPLVERRRAGSTGLLGKGATEGHEWRDGPIGYLGSEEQASLARSKTRAPSGKRAVFG